MKIKDADEIKILHAICMSKRWEINRRPCKKRTLIDCYPEDKVNKIISELKERGLINIKNVGEIITPKSSNIVGIFEREDGSIEILPGKEECVIDDFEWFSSDTSSGTLTLFRRSIDDESLKKICLNIFEDFWNSDCILEMGGNSKIISEVFKFLGANVDERNLLVELPKKKTKFLLRRYINPMGGQHSDIEGCLDFIDSMIYDRDDFVDECGGYYGEFMHTLSVSDKNKKYFMDINDDGEVYFKIPDNEKEKFVEHVRKYVKDVEDEMNDVGKEYGLMREGDRKWVKFEEERERLPLIEGTPKKLKVEVMKWKPIKIKNI